MAELESGRDSVGVRAVLDASPVSSSRGSLFGNWRCRMIKLGGMTNEIAYSWFTCRISDKSGGLWFEKSGTQRISGALYPHESGGYVLLGALSAKGEPAHRYSGNGPSAGVEATPDDVVGLLELTGRSSARIEFPAPVQESVFDVIEMKR